LRIGVMVRFDFFEDARAQGEHARYPLGHRHGGQIMAQLG
jgi:hypothetical protein